MTKMVPAHTIGLSSERGRGSHGVKEVLDELPVERRGHTGHSEEANMTNKSHGSNINDTSASHIGFKRHCSRFAKYNMYSSNVVDFLDSI